MECLEKEELKTEIREGQKINISIEIIEMFITCTKTIHIPQFQIPSQEIVFLLKESIFNSKILQSLFHCFPDLMLWEYKHV